MLSTGLSIDMQELVLGQADAAEPCPSTPKRRRKVEEHPPAGPGRPRRASPLMEAIVSAQHEQVSAVLEQAPNTTQAILEVYLESQTPALSLAISQGCPPRTIELFLQLGADAEMPDKFGATPAELLSRIRHEQPEKPSVPEPFLPLGSLQQFATVQADLVAANVRRMLDIALLLVRLGGVNPDMFRTRHGQTLVEVSAESDNHKLAKFWQHCLLEQALAPILPVVLQRKGCKELVLDPASEEKAKRHRGMFGTLPNGVNKLIFAFVAPDFVRQMIARGPRPVRQLAAPEPEMPPLPNLAC